MFYKFNFLRFAFIVCYFFLVNCKQSFLDKSTSNCQTPDGIAGTCTEIKECESMMDFLATQTTGISENTTDLMKKYKCGLGKEMVSICCPPTMDLFSETPPDVSKHRNIELLPKACGNIDTGDKILNGNSTGLFEFPWMALISNRNSKDPRFLCAGTIIHERYILTAAHCITGLRVPLLGVRVGKHDVKAKKDCVKIDLVEVCAPPYQDLSIEEVFVHPQYNITPFRNDIGLIRVSKMDISLQNAKPVCLPLEKAREYNFTNRYLTVTGWGVAEEGLKSDVLLKVNLPVIPLEECQKDYKHVSGIRITQKQICAGGKDRKDACAGDSGGPLLGVSRLHNEFRYIQQGIVSFGPTDCGKEDNPGVYTKVAFYTDWILDNMKQ